MIPMLKPAPLQRLTPDTPLVERVRLVNKAYLLIYALGGLLPGLKPESTHHITSVLDMACGPGIWALEFARKQQHSSVIGIDTSDSLITYARRISQQQAMGNAGYLTIPSFAEPFPFAEASFDFINIQFIEKFLKKDDWPSFLSACWRLLRPGGLIRLTEFELGSTNSPAHEELNRLIIDTTCLAHRGSLPSNRHSGFLCGLESLLYTANFHECVSVAHEIDYSYGAHLHEEWKRDALILSHQIQPLIVQMGLATQKQVATLYQQQHDEMNTPDFHAILPLLTVWGTKQ